MKTKANWAWLTWTAMAICGACSEQAPSEGGGCEDGATRSCVCEGGDDGGQVCTDGSWDACECDGAGNTTGGGAGNAAGGGAGNTTGGGAGNTTGAGGSSEAFCPGHTVATESDCKVPCVVVELIDSSEGPGPFGGQLWCAGQCNTDADCKNAGEICDVAGPTVPHTCVLSCVAASDCQGVGLPECSANNDGRLACF